jgi:hypothetical protein
MDGHQDAQLKIDPSYSHLGAFVAIWFGSPEVMSV